MNATILQSTSQTASSTASSNASSNTSSPRRISKTVLAGRIISGIVVVLLTMDASMKLFGVKEAVEGTAKLGFASNVLLPLGLIQIAGLIMYLFPRTAALGALLWTGYLGGAVAVHVQLGNPMFTHVLSPVYVATFLWLGLFLRDERIRAVLGARP
ncbi:MAG: DoxX family protein [Gemmatimonadaceae bacterium]